MKRQIILLLPVFLILSFSCRNNSTGKNEAFDTYYLNTATGSDKNPGTQKRPLKSVSELNLRIKAKPKSICFTGGQVFDGTLILDSIARTDTAMLVISSYGEGRAVIYGGNNEAIKIENCMKIIVKDIDLKGSGRKDGNTTNGLSLTGSVDCVVRNINSSGFQKSGVDLYNCRNIKVTGVIASDNGFCGINVMGSDQKLSGNILIKDCKAENNPGDPTILDNHSGNGILVGVSDSVLIDHCTATNNGWDMPRLGNGPVGIWAWMSDHVTIQYCISYRNRTSKGGKDGGGFDFDGGMTNSLIQYCLSYENEGAGYGLFQYPGAANWSNNVIRYCVSINDATTTEGAGSFFIWNGSEQTEQLTNCYIYNNVAVSNSAPIISFEIASLHEGFIFTNNIFIGSGALIRGTNNGSRFLGNVWWSQGNTFDLMQSGSLSDWIKKTGQEKAGSRIIGIQADPLLAGPLETDITDPYMMNSLSGFMLQNGSPVIDKGQEIKSVYGFNPPDRDFFGNTVPSGSAPEPGIHEIK